MDPADTLGQRQNGREQIAVNVCEQDCVSLRRASFQFLEIIADKDTFRAGQRQSTLGARCPTR